MFRKQEVVAFEGLNSAVAPELINDGEARDIYNFRMEKIGKLVSRASYATGLYWDKCSIVLDRPIILSYSVCQNPNVMIETPRRRDAYINNLGIIGIGEYVLETFWEAADTDRVMVYYIRSNELNPDYKPINPLDLLQSDDDKATHRNETNPARDQRRHSMFLLSALTGVHKDKIMLGAIQDYDAKIPKWQIQNAYPLQDVGDKRISSPQGNYNQRIVPDPNLINDTRPLVVQLYAPNKEPNIPNDEWIKQYVDMHQYRDKLVISDYINGDMFIEDEYSRVFENKDDIRIGGGTLKTKISFTPPHMLSLRPNALETFDVEVVDITLRDAPGEENDALAGVENGMALYKYELPKKRQKVSRDNSNNLLSSAEELGLTVLDDGTEMSFDERTERLAVSFGKAWSAFATSKTKFRYLGAISRANFIGQVNVDHNMEASINLMDISDEVATFTNAENNDEFFDVFGKLELPEEEYYDDDGILIKERSADVYIWEDMPLQYYPSSGVVTGDGFMTEADRFFSKGISGTPRLTELDELDDAGKQVPLGVWKYRFVWDFGDGVYSAPSAELLVPDRIWSAVKDSEIADAPYARPASYYGTTPQIKTNTLDTVLAPYSMHAGLYQPPAIYDYANNDFTPLGRLFKQIKDKLYEGIDCKYSVPEGDISTWDKLDYGNFATLITADFGAGDVILKGIIYEGMLMSHMVSTFGFYSPLASLNDVKHEHRHLKALYDDVSYYGLDNYYEPAAAHLVVPIFKSPSRSYTYNSIFDDEGRYRYAWSNLFTDEEPNIYQIVFPGVHPNIPSTPTPYNSGNGQLINRYSTQNFVNTLHNKDSRYYESDNLYLNIICQDDITTGDMNNGTRENYLLIPENINTNRPNTIFRAVKTSADRLINIAEQDFEAVNRLILSGATAELDVIKRENKFGVTSQFQTYRKDEGFKTSWDIYDTVSAGLGYFQLREYKGIRKVVGTAQFDSLKRLLGYALYRSDAYFFYLSNNPYALTDNSSWSAISQTGNMPDYFKDGEPDGNSNNNIEVTIYGEAERNIALEQLTAYFPSSLLYNAPRYGIQIKNELIPTRAKRLLIYRTKSINANDYDPHTFGLVKAVDIERATINKDEYIDPPDFDFEQGDAITHIEAGDVDYKGVYFFDDVKDSLLDFSDNISRHEGLRKPLHSRFNTSINENVYFANYLEEYNPLLPRKTGVSGEEGYEVDIPNVGLQRFGVPLQNVSHKCIKSNTGYNVGDTAVYKFCYIDVAGVRSPEQEYTVTVVPAPLHTAGDLYSIVLYFLPSTYDPSIEKLLIYRKPTGSLEYFLLGELEKTSVGIYVDNNVHKHTTFNTWKPNIQKYAGGVRWSERYRSDWIKYENMAEYGSGDGEMITGLLSNYGNLLVFKEKSIYRVAVQAANPPISRTDEAVPDVGCIAPNTLISVDNTAYFLSWKGWMRYDNNIPQKIDGKFDEELQFYISVLGDKIRDATSGYNPATNEIYLNLPQLKINDLLLYADWINDPDTSRTLVEFVNGRLQTKFYNIDYDDVFKIYEREEWFYLLRRRFMGNIYVINLTTGFATKYGYQPTIVGKELQSPLFLKRDPYPQNGVRMYHTNTLGEMRSAEIMPSVYGDTLTHAGIHIETPHLVGAMRFNDTDEILDGYFYYNKPQSAYNTDLFPTLYRYPVRSSFKSKMFTGGDETLIKRIRKTLLNIYSKGKIRVETYYNNYDATDDRIENNNKLHNIDYAGFPKTGKNIYRFNPTVSRTGNYAEDRVSPDIVGRQTNILQIVPQSQYDDDTVSPFSQIFDLDGKPIRYSIEIYSEYRTQINEISFYWRPIHEYLA